MPGTTRPLESDANWHDVGAEAELTRKPIQQVVVDRVRIALVHKGGEFTAISGVCNHVGGPLGEGVLEGDYVVCPWHQYRFHRRTGEGEPGYEEDRVPAHDIRVEAGRVLVNVVPRTRRSKLHHPPHRLERIAPRGTPGGPPLDAPLRVVGISTTLMNEKYPRFSTSEHLLEAGLEHAQRELSVETRLIRLRTLQFRPCEGYYSKSAHACTWPCSITQMDPEDQLDRVYEAFVQWADIFLIATPIRWGSASSLYYKMVERMNCIQNQETIANRILLRNKVVGFIVTGGQDNVQAVVGQMMTFFGELGCQFPQFPFIGHSLGWTAEDMERNVAVVQGSDELRVAACQLVARCVDTASALIGRRIGPERVSRGGRKAGHM